jgi:hypothetical protein
MKPAVNIRNEPGSPYADWIVDAMEEIGAPYDKIKTFDEWINA